MKKFVCFVLILIFGLFNFSCLAYERWNEPVVSSSSNALTDWHDNRIFRMWQEKNGTRCIGLYNNGRMVYQTDETYNEGHYDIIDNTLIIYDMPNWPYHIKWTINFNGASLTLTSPEDDVIKLKEKEWLRNESSTSY